MTNDSIARRSARRGWRVEKQEGSRTERRKYEGRTCENGQGSHDPDADTAVDEAEDREDRYVSVVLQEPGKAYMRQDAAQDIRHLAPDGVFAINTIVYATTWKCIRWIALY